MNDHQGFKTVHYQPAGQTTVCKFKRFVIAEVADGRMEEFSVLKVPSTTDVRRVTCPQCITWLKNTITQIPSAVREWT